MATIPKWFAFHIKLFHCYLDAVQWRSASSKRSQYGNKRWVQRQILGLGNKARKRQIPNIFQSKDQVHEVYDETKELEPQSQQLLLFQSHCVSHTSISRSCILLCKKLTLSQGGHFGQVPSEGVQYEWYLEWSKAKDMWNSSIRGKSPLIQLTIWDIWGHHRTTTSILTSICNMSSNNIYFLFCESRALFVRWRSLEMPGR